MNDKELDSLLERFASDNISDSEQEQLIEEIASNHMPAAPDGLEQRLNETIDTLDASERTRHSITVTPRRRHTARIIIGIAASIAVVTAIGIHLYAPPVSVPPTPLDTCATPEEAYAETQRALLIFASALDKGMHQMEIVQSTAENVHEKLTQQFEHTNIDI